MKPLVRFPFLAIVVAAGLSAQTSRPTPDHAKAKPSKAGQAKAGQAKAGQAKAGQAKAGQAKATPADVKRALATWLKSAGRGEKLRAETVETLLQAGRPGLDVLAARITASEKGAEGALGNRTLAGLDELTGQVALRWLSKVQTSGMVYAGQYGDLRVLMPHVGDYYSALLVDTPQWFSIDDRWKVVAALRDLYPKGPDEAIRDRVEGMAKDGAEPAYLRQQLAYALAQWGDRKLIKTKIKELDAKARDKDEETAILALRDLAQLHYDIRDYSLAAVTNQEFIRRSEATDYYLVPVYYYNTACCLCLSGNRRSALDYLKRSLELNKSTKIDPSMRLKRKLFENDPEIALLRSGKGFAAMLDQAFGPASAIDEEDEKKRKDRASGGARRESVKRK